MTVIAVRPELLLWAREHRGLSEQEAADVLSMTEADLAAFEAGRPVNLTMFRRFSDRYQIPRATLLRRTPPEVPPEPKDFRTFVGRPPRIGFATRLAIGYARTIEQNVLELVEAGIAPPTPALARIRMEEDPAEAGERERERLGVPIVTQMAWHFAEAFNNWRAIIEGTGVYVLMQKFEPDECRGFTVYGDLNAPIIVLTKSELYDPAKTFTLIHEYAHLLLREPGLSDLNARNPVEAYCNRFAAAFLMPRAALREILPYWPNEPVNWIFDDVRTWARRLKVSQQALALRLEDLGLAPDGFYIRFANLPPIERRDEAGGNYVLTQMSEMGVHYLRAVLDARDLGGIKDAEAAEMTQLAPKHFEQVRDHVHRRFERIGAVAGGIPN